MLEDKLKKIEHNFKEKVDKIDNLPFFIKKIRKYKKLNNLFNMESKLLLPFVEKNHDSYKLIFCIVIESQTKNGKKIYFSKNYFVLSYPELSIIEVENTKNSKLEYNSDDNIIISNGELENIENQMKNNENFDIYNNKIKKVYNFFVFGEIQQEKLIEPENIKTWNKKNNNINNADDYVNKIKVIKEKISQLKDIISIKDNRIYDNKIVNIEKIMELTKFSVAVVGEFSRGKSSFLNKLLNRNLLPIGDIPTTNMVTRILHDENESFFHINYKKEKKEYPFENKTWEYFDTEDGKDPEGVIDLKINNEWLKKSKIVLFDTPGAGDLEDIRMKLVEETIMKCSGIIITINANMALSQTEIFFIQNSILSKSIPKILVLVTKLDLVNKNEQKKCVEYIKNKFNLFKTKILLGTIETDLIEESKPFFDVIGIDEVKDLITNWPFEKDYFILKLNQVKQLLSNLIIDIKTENLNILDVLHISDEEKQERIKQIEEIMSNLKLDFESICLKLDNKKLKLFDTVKKKLLDVRNELLDELDYRIKQIRNPKEFVKFTLPYFLSKKLKQYSAIINDDIKRNISADFTWAQEEISKIIEKKYENIRIEFSSIKLNKLDDLHKISVEDISSQKIKSRLIVTTATIFAYMQFGPVGIAVSAIGGLVNEKILQNKIEKQKEIIFKEIKNKITTLFNNEMIKINENIDKTYRQVSKNIEINIKNSLEIKKETFIKEIPDKSNEIKKTKQQNNQLLNIQNEIINC